MYFYTTVLISLHVHIELYTLLIKVVALWAPESDSPAQ